MHAWLNFRVALLDPYFQCLTTFAYYSCALKVRPGFESQALMNSNDEEQSLASMQTAQPADSSYHALGPTAGARWRERSADEDEAQQEAVTEV